METGLAQLDHLATHLVLYLIPFCFHYRSSGSYKFSIFGFPIFQLF